MPSTRPGVGGEHALTARAHEQRIHVDLRDAVGVVGDQQRHARQRIRERIDVERRAAAIALEAAPRP